MLGANIIVSSPPGGVFNEGTIGDTSKPGTMMQMAHNTPFIGAEPVWISANVGTNGYVGASAILLEDHYQGKLATDAYVANTRGFIYFPRVGEEFNMACDVGAGTSNTITQGDLLMLNSNTGVLIPLSGDPAGPIFQAMETLTLVAAGTLCWCKLLSI